jgi:hypothetical protein
VESIEGSRIKQPLGISGGILGARPRAVPETAYALFSDVYT